MATLDANGVPILDLAPSSAEFVQDKHRAYLDSEGDPEHLLTGALVFVHVPDPINLDHEDVVRIVIGGETLDEALKSVVGTIDSQFGSPPYTPYLADAPAWVASTNDDLARLLAEHYSGQSDGRGGSGDCEARPLDEVPDIVAALPTASTEETP